MITLVTEAEAEISRLRAIIEAYDQLVCGLEVNLELRGKLVEQAYREGFNAAQVYTDILGMWEDSTVRKLLLK